MKILVVHATALGSTAEIAAAIARSLETSGAEVELQAADHAVDPSPFDAVVVGSAVHGGHWLPAATRWAHEHEVALARRPVWLFSVGPIGTVNPAQITDPREVVDLRRTIAPRDHRVFFGAHDRSNPAIASLPRLERFVARRFLPDGDFRDWRAIEAWAVGIAEALRRTAVAAG